MFGSSFRKNEYVFSSLSNISLSLASFGSRFCKIIHVFSSLSNISLVLTSIYSSKQKFNNVIEILD